MNDQSTYGELERQADGQWRLRYERALPHPAEEVWSALTEPAHLSAWFPTTIEGERVAGAPLRFVFPDGVAPDMDGEMLAFQPPRLMELRWGPDLLRFELADAAGGTKLTFTVMLEELGKAARDGAGWHSCLGMLEAELDGAGDRSSASDRWRDVRDEYKRRFGAEASTLGPPEEWEKAHGAAS